MNKGTRLTILLLCIICFFTAAPYIILYSLGYRVDFENLKITATGGVYVRTFPPADEIIIDSKISKKPGVFNSSIFVQSLLPKDHTVSITKAGYYDYTKTLPVKEKEVTKLENVLLFKKDILFEVIADETQSPFVQQAQQERFIIKNNNLYYSNNPVNADMAAAEKSVPVIKSLVAFALQDNNLIWLGADGFLYKSDLAGLPDQMEKNKIKLTLAAIKIVKTGSYKIISDGQYIFVNNNGNLLSLNARTNNLDSFSNPVKDAVISPDGKNIVYFNDKEIHISLMADLIGAKTLLYKTSGKIGNCLWLNNDYIIFTDGPASPSQGGDKIIISEIDERGNINAIVLPQTITLLTGKKIDIISPQIFFDRQSSKLYIQTQNTLLATEKLTP